MITTLTLNPCVDKTITIKGFNYGGLNRVVRTRNDFSGKGINVSIAVHQLGERTKCLGFSYLHDSAFAEESLAKIGLDHEFIGVEGSLRTNIKIFDEDGQIMTEFNEHGQPVNAGALDELKRLVTAHLGYSEIMVFNGSVPLGVPEDIYRTLIETTKKAGVKTVLDAEGELFLEGIKAGPYLVKPNLYEFESAFNVKVNNNQDIVRVSRKIIENGVGIVCVSLGKKGAVIVSKDEAWYAPGSDIKVRGVQGAGDSLVAGICLAIKGRLGLDQMLRYGVAAANASLLRDGTLLCTLDDFRKMLTQVSVERVNF